MGFWSRLGKGTVASIGAITTPFLTGLGMVADGLLFVASSGLALGTGGTIGIYDKPFCTMAATSLLAGSRELLHEACAPKGKEQSFISKAIEKSILGASFIASAVTSVALMFKALPALAGGAAVAAGTFCVGALGAAIYQGYSALSGKKDKNHHQHAQQDLEPVRAKRLQQKVDLSPEERIHQQDSQFRQEATRNPVIIAYSQNRGDFRPMIMTNPETKTEHLVYKDRIGNVVITPATPELRRQLDEVVKRLAQPLVPGDHTRGGNSPVRTTRSQSSKGLDTF
jgi:hypothetical protein